MIFDKAFSDIKSSLATWDGYSVLAEAIRSYEGLQVYIAGGVVRDAVMSRTIRPKDFDFFLHGQSVNEALNLLKDGGHLQTTPYGSPRWYPAGCDDQYADIIPISEFKPGLWHCEDIVDVLNQFDFTANAIAFDLRTGKIFDPQNGARDAIRRVMKMVRFDYPDGPYIPSESLCRNVILWFRIVHYSGSLRLNVEPLTLKWILEHRHYAMQREQFEANFFKTDLSFLEEIHA